MGLTLMLASKASQICSYVSQMGSVPGARLLGGDSGWLQC